MSPAVDVNVTASFVLLGVDLFLRNDDEGTVIPSEIRLGNCERAESG